MSSRIDVHKTSTGRLFLKTLRDRVDMFKSTSAIADDFAATVPITVAGEGNTQIDMHGLGIDLMSKSLDSSFYNLYNEGNVIKKTQLERQVMRKFIQDINSILNLFIKTDDQIYALLDKFNSTATTSDRSVMFDNNPIKDIVNFDDETIDAIKLQFKKEKF